MRGTRFAASLPIWVIALLSCLSLEFVASNLTARELSDLDREEYKRCRALQDEGDWVAARKVAQRLVSRFEEAGPSSALLVFANELANLNQRLGNYGAALERYRFCLETVIQLEGEESKSTAQVKNNLAALLVVLGQFEEAETLNREALETRVALDGKTSPGTVPAMNNLAGLLWCIGDLAAAEGLFREGLRIREIVLGRESLDAARSLANLAGLLFYRGEIVEARNLADRAVTIFEAELGATHPDTLEALLFFGDLERAAGRAEIAEAAYKRVFEGRVEAFETRDHAEVAEALRRLGDARREQGQNREAMESYQESDEIYLKVLPAWHPDRLEGLFGIGLAALAAEDRETAADAARQCAEIEFSQFEAMLSFTDERQRLAYQDIFRSQHLFAGLKDAEAIAKFLIRQKGVVSDSLITEARLSRESSDPQVQALRDELAATRAEYRTVYLGAAEATRSLEELEAEIRALQSKLLQSLSPGGKTISRGVPSLAEIQSALAEDEIVLDYFEYDAFQPSGTSEKRIGMIALSRDEVQFFECCSAKEADDLIAEMIPFFGNGNPGTTGDAVAVATMQQLYRLLLAPASDAIMTTSRLIISPEGSLAFVPFSCLIDAEGQFLVERFDLQYFSSAREVARREAGAVKAGKVLLVGNPAFQMEAEEVVEVPDRRGFLATMRPDDLASMAASIGPLVGAEKEVELLAPLVEDKLGHDAEALIGSEATEPEIRDRLDQPAVVHFATHGIYLPKVLSAVSEYPTDSPYVPEEVAGFQNPMFGSWLALAGSGATVSAWARGAVPDPDADGVLMANEAAELNLEGTQLVTLSACDTASGEATTGDGVLGLRRGFRLAGARNILSTLWPINDAATVVMMQEFYPRLVDSDPATALCETQRKWLVSIRDNSEASPTGPIPVSGSYYAIYLAGPFLMGR